MSLRPFFEASLVIQIHEIAAVLAFLLGAMVLWRRKGNASHRFAGRIWVGLMLTVAISSIFIHEIKMWGNYSPIHILTLVTLISLPLAIRFARRGNIHAHQQAMQGTYIGGMLIAGGLTFLPGRLNFEILFGESIGIGGMWGSVIGVGSAVVVFFLLLANNRRAGKT